MIKIYKFDDFLLSAETRHLFRGKNAIRLSSHAFDILLFLVQKRGTVVKKNVLLENVWSDTFVNETNLTVHVSALRRVLGEKRGENRYIETVAGRGYCFVAPVEEIVAGEKLSFNENLESLKTKKPGNKTLSLAILPFTNDNGMPALEYLSDGVTEDLIGNLSHLPQLKVFARSAVIHYKNQNLNLQEIGFLLGADVILTGHTLLIDEHLEISVELINVFDQSYVWGNRYEFRFDNIFKIKTEISLAIAEKLQIKLTELDFLQLRHQATVNSNAYKLYLKGRYVIEKRTKKDFLKGIEYFQQALKEDSKYELAYTGIADAYFLLGAYSHLSALETIPKAKNAIERALGLNEKLSEAHSSNAQIQFRYEWKWQDAEKSLKRAIALNSNNAVALRCYSSLLCFLGRSQESLSYQYRALELDPLSLYLNHDLGFRFNWMGEYGKAIVQFEEILEIEPNYLFAISNLAISYAKLGFYESALDCVEKALGVSFSLELVSLRAWIYALSGDQVQAREILKTLLVRSRSETIEYTDLATIYTALGENQTALEYIEKAIATKSPNVCGIKIDPRLETLRTEPKFAVLLEQIGLN